MAQGLLQHGHLVVVVVVVAVAMMVRTYGWMDGWMDGLNCYDDCAPMMDGSICPIVKGTRWKKTAWVTDHLMTTWIFLDPARAREVASTVLMTNTVRSFPSKKPKSFKPSQRTTFIQDASSEIYLQHYSQHQSLLLLSMSTIFCDCSKLSQLPPLRLGRLPIIPIY
jgi:hypothetical protein